MGLSAACELEGVGSLLPEPIRRGSRNVRAHSAEVRLVRLASMIDARHRFALAHPLLEFVINAGTFGAVPALTSLYQLSTPVVVALLLIPGALRCQERRPPVGLPDHMLRVAAGS